MTIVQRMMHAILFIIGIDFFQYSAILCNKIKKEDRSRLSTEIIETQKDFGYLFHNFRPLKLYTMRRSNADRDKKYFEVLPNSFNAVQFKKWLREEITGNVEAATQAEAPDEFRVLVENELLNALSKKAAAVLDRPFLQKKGRNDFLVIKPNLKDPFVTIVPNDIYYNAEKKCVNWLDDCNRKGLRERLLQKVNSPYK
ncbi:unnamed protein product, partial [Brenthis ino]